MKLKPVTCATEINFIIQDWKTTNIQKNETRLGLIRYLFKRRPVTIDPLTQEEIERLKKIEKK